MSNQKSISIINNLAIDEDIEEDKLVAHSPALTNPHILNSIRWIHNSLSQLILTYNRTKSNNKQNKAVALQKFLKNSKVIEAAKEIVSHNANKAKSKFFELSSFEGAIASQNNIAFCNSRRENNSFGYYSILPKNPIDSHSLLESLNQSIARGKTKI